MEIIKRIPQLTDSLTMKKTSNLWLLLWRGISFATLLHLVVFDLLILNSPERLQVQFTPDDGYYYLTLARNFVRFGAWTFDGGLSLTSGFHLVQAYVLAGFYTLFQPTLSGFVRLGLGFGASITIVAVCMAWWVCLRKNDVFALIAFTILVTAKPFLFNSVSITEWPLVILIAGLYCLSFYRQGRAGRIVLFGPGLLGSLARSDFGLLPLSIFIAAFILERRDKDKLLTRESFAGVLGAVLGLGIVFVHNFITTGAVVQSSALMKSHWATFLDQKFYNAMALILKVIGLDLGFADFDRSIFLLGVLLISGPLVLIILAKLSGQKDVSFAKVSPSADQPLRERVLVLAAGLCLIGYSLFYAYNGAIQHWYTANLVWPIFILLVAGAHYLDQRLLNEQQFTLIWLSIFALTALVVQISSLYPLSERTSPWPHQQVMLEAGRYLAQNPPDGYVGSWNSGVVGYYRDGTDVVNIDGLVNNDIYPYAVSNSLPDYLRDKGIKYILDFENMFHPPFPERGGYSDPGFLARLKLVKEFDQGQFEEFKFLRLYRINW
jgi:hypothetical protein